MGTKELRELFQRLHGEGRHVPDIVRDVMARLELEPGLHITRLIESQDDSTLIVRCVSLIEASVNDLLRNCIPQSKLGEFLANERSLGRKTQIAEAAGLLSPQFLKCIAQINSLRNEVVHDAKRALTFSFEQYFSEHPDKKASFDAAMDPLTAWIPSGSPPPAKLPKGPALSLVIAVSQIEMWVQLKIWDAVDTRAMLETLFRPPAGPRAV